jgi:L,D-peptidoglycan transpeptidase YkuD (ErfK/YbiS/YcfS/YnhG family)
MKIFFALFMLFFTSLVYANSDCQLIVGAKKYHCVLGRSGVTAQKKEGDGATPLGDFTLEKVFYRADRIAKNTLHTQLPLIALQPNMGWCDDVHSPFYNQQVQLPFTASHENLWRDDQLYNIIVVVAYNQKPIVKGKGSAIFLHVASDDYRPTAGCIAFSQKDLLEILKVLGPRTHLKIQRQQIILTNN